MLNRLPDQTFITAPAVNESEDKELRFQCQTCPYIYAIDRKVRAPAHVPVPERPICSVRSTLTSLYQISRAMPLKKKEVDDVLGGEDAWKNVQTTTGAPCASTHCPYCMALYPDRNHLTRWQARTLLVYMLIKTCTPHLSNLL